MHHKFYNCNTPNNGERSDHIIGFSWSTQRGMCFLGRHYDGSKFRFRNYGAASKINNSDSKRRKRAERIAKSKSFEKEVGEFLREHRRESNNKEIDKDEWF